MFLSSLLFVPCIVNGVARVFADENVAVFRRENFGEDGQGFLRAANNVVASDGVRSEQGVPVKAFYHPTNNREKLGHLGNCGAANGTYFTFDRGVFEEAFGVKLLAESPTVLDVRQARGEEDEFYVGKISVWGAHEIEGAEYAIGRREPGGSCEHCFRDGDRLRGKPNFPPVDDRDSARVKPYHHPTNNREKSGICADADGTYFVFKDLNSQDNFDAEIGDLRRDGQVYKVRQYRSSDAGDEHFYAGGVKVWAARTVDGVKYPAMGRREPGGSCEGCFKAGDIIQGY